MKEKNGKHGESLVEEENENEVGNVDERKVQQPTRFGRCNHNHNARRINHPRRPDAKDCSYYVKFGLNCKFNHRPWRKNQGAKEKAKHREENSEKDEQNEYKGETVSVLHPQYGSNCRFHHPDPTVVPGGGSPSGYDNAGSFPPKIISSHQSLHGLYQGHFLILLHLYRYCILRPNTLLLQIQNGMGIRFEAAVYPTSERSLPIRPAFCINNLSTEINFPVKHQYDAVVEKYPACPGVPECSFFQKTGDCKFKSDCRYHHPKNRNSNTKVNSFSLNDKGLPLRPDQPICTHYQRYGICKYGPACKYDHSPKFAILQSPLATEQLMMMMMLRSPYNRVKLNLEHSRLKKK